MRVLGAVLTVAFGIWLAVVWGDPRPSPNWNWEPTTGIVTHTGQLVSRDESSSGVAYRLDTVAYADWRGRRREAVGVPMNTRLVVGRPTQMFVNKDGQLWFYDSMDSYDTADESYDPPSNATASGAWGVLEGLLTSAGLGGLVAMVVFLIPARIRHDRRRRRDAVIAAYESEPVPVLETEVTTLPLFTITTIVKTGDLNEADDLGSAMSEMLFACDNGGAVEVHTTRPDEIRPFDREYLRSCGLIEPADTLLEAT